LVPIKTRVWFDKEQLQMATPEPSPATDAVERAQRVLDQDHERLHSISRRIQRSASDGSALAAALQDLHAALLEHFAREEHPQALAGILVSKTQAERDAFAEILAEHESILSNVEELEEQSRTGKAVPAGLAAQAVMLSSFLGDHERRENQLMRALLAPRPSPAT
jgi:hemerythrin